MSSYTPSIAQRLVALTICPAYLVLVANVFSAITGISLWVTFPVVLLSALAIVAVLLIFAVKAYRHAVGRFRFTVGTALLAMVPVCIYLMALQQVLHVMPREQWGPALFITLGAFGLFGAYITTGILFYFAEALVWLARCIQKRWSRAENR